MPNRKPYPRPNKPKKKPVRKKRGGLVVPSKKVGSGMTTGRKKSPYKKK